MPVAPGPGNVAGAGKRSLVSPPSGRQPVPDNVLHRIPEAVDSSSVVYTLGVMRHPVHSSWPMPTDHRAIDSAPELVNGGRVVRQRRARANLLGAAEGLRLRE